jgi:hypothetical protein
VGVVRVLRAERSDRKEDEVEGMEAPGTMVSFWMVATRPRWEDEVRRVPRADLSSWEAGGC